MQGYIFHFKWLSIIGKSNVPPRSHTNASSGSATSDHTPFFSLRLQSSECVALFSGEV